MSRIEKQQQYIVTCYMYQEIILFIVTWQLSISAQSPLARPTPEEEESTPGTNVSVPSISDDVAGFFRRSDSTQGTAMELDVSVDDFNELFLEAGDM